MNISKEDAKKKIQTLIERFNEHVIEYKENNYNEHQTRIDYINPFFKALGWDIDNEQGLAEAYREVIHEDKIKIGKTIKAPDYCLTAYGQRKFFVDAKKPSINIHNDKNPAFQVRRYGWSAKLKISIVTNFEELAVYDCSSKPKETDKASTTRIKYLTYETYLEDFDFIWNTFSKEAILKGRFDKFSVSDMHKRGTTAVDHDFLQAIEDWRSLLAKNVALRNKELDEYEINHVVQKTIDRIVFLRICEDRGVEPYGNLKNVLDKNNTYSKLYDLYQNADDRYNSGLFNLKQDQLTKSLMIDDKVIKNIIKDLYYPYCEYEFSVMPADLLGSVYERFLGKKIKLSSSNKVTIEEKPEVKKLGGGYFTLLSLLLIT